MYVLWNFKKVDISPTDIFQNFEKTKEKRNTFKQATDVEQNEYILKNI